MSQNSVPVFLNGKQKRVRPNMKAWNRRPNPLRRENMEPGPVVVYRGAEAQQVANK